MSSEIAIKVENLSKCYQIYSQPHDRLKQSIYPRLQRLAGQQPKQYFREFWALKDVSFEIKKGETVGIIGRNGSGKSTLLQMICGTLNLTSGSIEANGRIAALLELGSGFNPEFTGRENVYMNAAVLGLCKEEIDARYDKIVAFADIGAFIEQPVKTYSSGMFARLAFAVAIHVDPNILIVDEALSVGDFAFQYKCFRRLKALTEAGCTVLLVTHDIEQVQKLCSRALYLDNGKTVFFGAAKVACERYLAEGWTSAERSPGLTGSLEAQASVSTALPAVWDTFAQRVAPYRRGDRHSGEILHVSLNGSDSDNQRIDFDEPVSVIVVFRLLKRLQNPTLAIYITDKTGQLIVGTNTGNERLDLASCEPGRIWSLTFAFDNRLREDSYALQIYLADVVGSVQTDFIDYLEMVLPFQSVGLLTVKRWAWFTPHFSTQLAPMKVDLQ